MSKVISRKEIDIETMRLRRKLAGYPDDAVGLTYHIVERLAELRQLRESIARPFEKVRPVDESQLSRYGVV